MAKRLFDIVFSGAAIVVLLPAMVMIGAAILLTSGGPVLYRGVRAGVAGGKFRIIKFRTMRPDAEQAGGYSTAVDDPRFTRVGRFLRRYKLDELPQFFNVILGDMSLVGPRPQVLHYTSQYTGDDCLILTVRPGITDLASLYFSDMDQTLGSGDVDGKYASEIEPVKNRLRVRYVRERSFFLDLRILTETTLGLFGIKNATGLDLRP